MQGKKGGVNERGPRGPGGEMEGGGKGERWRGAKQKKEYSITTTRNKINLQDQQPIQTAIYSRSTREGG